MPAIERRYRLAASAMMPRVVSHESPIAFAKTSSDCVLVSRMLRSIIAVGTPDMTHSAATISSNLSVAANSSSFVGVSSPPRCSEHLRCGIIERLIVSRGPDAVGHLAHDVGDIGLQVLALDLELGAHFFGGDLEQFFEQPR